MAYLQSSVLVGKLWRSLFIFLHNIWFYEQKLSCTFPVPALALLMVLGRVVPWVAAVAVIVAVRISVAAVVASTSFPGFSSIVKPHFTDTHLIWTPCYYGQFALSPGKESSYFSLNSTRIIRTPLIRTLSVALSRSVCINAVWLYLSPKVQVK